VYAVAAAEPRRAAIVWLQDGRCLLEDRWALHDAAAVDASGWLALRGTLDGREAEPVTLLRAEGPEAGACPVVGRLLHVPVPGETGFHAVLFDHSEVPRLAFSAEAR
jgi:hypothetical protein